MKNFIKNLLWFLLDKLDPAEIHVSEIGKEKLVVYFKKNFFRVNKWTHAAVTVNWWLKSESRKVGKGGKVSSTSIGELAVYKNGEEENVYKLAKAGVGEEYPFVAKK